jgi:hypothetical protein
VTSYDNSLIASSSLLFNTSRRLEPSHPSGSLCVILSCRLLISERHWESRFLISFLFIASVGPHRRVMIILPLSKSSCQMANSGSSRPRSNLAYPIARLSPVRSCAVKMAGLVVPNCSLVVQMRSLGLSSVKSLMLASMGYFRAVSIHGAWFSKVRWLALPSRSDRWISQPPSA